MSLMVRRGPKDPDYHKAINTHSMKQATPQPLCLVIAGPNGAGKSTFAREFLPVERKIVHFINADLIATGLSPLKPELAAVAAGKLFLREFDRLVLERKSFAFETTLSGTTYIRRLQDLKLQGYRLEIVYLGLASAAIAIRRVKARVTEGGHSVPPPDIRRRYKRSHDHFIRHYRELADSWWYYDNSGAIPCLLEYLENS
jgi:predicted ABC-type ATPase